MRSPRLALALAALLSVSFAACEGEKAEEKSEESSADEGADETPTAFAEVTSVALRWELTPTPFGERHSGLVTVGVDVPAPDSGQMLSVDVTCMGSGGRAFSDEATTSLGTQTSAQLELPVFTASNAFGKAAPDSVLTTRPPKCQLDLFTHELDDDAVWVQVGTWCRTAGGVKSEPCTGIETTDTAGAKVALDETTATFVQDRKGMPWTVQASYLMTAGEEMPMDTYVQSKFDCVAAEGEPVSVEDPLGAPLAPLAEGESARIEKTYVLGEHEPTACTWELRRMTLPDDAGTLIRQACITVDGVTDGACEPPPE